MKSEAARKVKNEAARRLIGSDAIIRGTRLLGLSPRETQLVPLLAQGWSAQAVAYELSLSVGTVNTYVRRVYVKLGITSRAELVARVYQAAYDTSGNGESRDESGTSK